MSARSRALSVVPAMAVASVLTLAALAVAPAAVAAPKSSDASSDEAGYVVSGSKFSEVSASWRQPTANCAGSADSDTALWVGLDGFGSGTTEQTGTAMECSNGQASYAGWYEMYPAAPVYFDMAVNPGDEMSAGVTVSGSTFTLTLQDATQGWSKKTTATSAGAQSASAEIMTEVPTGITSPGNSVTFTQATANGRALGLSDPEQITSPGMTVTPIGTGETFSVTW